MKKALVLGLGLINVTPAAFGGATSSSGSLAPFYLECRSETVEDKFYGIEISDMKNEAFVTEYSRRRKRRVFSSDTLSSSTFETSRYGYVVRYTAGSATLDVHIERKIKRQESYKGYLMVIGNDEMPSLSLPLECKYQRGFIKD